MDAYFYRGPALDVYVSTPIKTRFSLGEKDKIGLAIAGALNRQPLTLADPAFNAHSAFAAEADWARQLLADPEAKSALLRLVPTEVLELRQVHLLPEAFHLRLYRVRTRVLTPENLTRWFDDLMALARAAERLPLPRQVVEASALEQKTRVNRDAFTLPAIGIVLALIAGLLLCFTPFVALLIYLDSR